MRVEGERQGQYMYQDCIRTNGKRTWNFYAAKLHGDGQTFAIQHRALSQQHAAGNCQAGCHGLTHERVHTCMYRTQRYVRAAAGTLPMPPPPRVPPATSRRNVGCAFPKSSSVRDGPLPMGVHTAG